MPYKDPAAKRAYQNKWCLERRKQSPGYMSQAERSAKVDPERNRAVAVAAKARYRKRAIETLDPVYVREVLTKHTPVPQSDPSITDEVVFLQQALMKLKRKIHENRRTAS